MPGTLAFARGCRIKPAAKTGAMTTEMHLRAAASLQVDLQDQGAINDSRRSGAGAQNGFSEAAGVYATASRRSKHARNPS
jgi:hypothetical protein